METQLRKKYLETQWKAYPIAPENCFSVSKFLRERPRTDRVWVAGKLISLEEKDSGRVIIGLWNQGGSIKIRLGFLAAQWSGIEELRKWSDLLEIGDELALEIPSARQLEAEPVEARKMVLLAPCHRSQLADSFDFTCATQWQGFIDAVRQFFKDLDFLEVQTPSLVECPGLEPFLDVFSTEFVFGSQRQLLFLPTSPELHLKKLLARGFTEIFEIKTCFRNGEISPYHEPEFNMLEWYRAYSDAALIKKDLQQMIFKLVEGQVFSELEAPVFTEVSMAELFAEYADFKLTPQTTKAELLALASKLDIPVDSDSNWDEVFHFLFLSRIEPRLASLGACFIYDFPPSQAALARINSRGWADRWEFYWRGIEIANAFHELNDPREQRKRFVKDQRAREVLQKNPLTIDEDFMAHLETGMPPAGGVALGLERLFLACLNLNEIRQIKAFSWFQRQQIEWS